MVIPINFVEISPQFFQNFAQFCPNPTNFPKNFCSYGTALTTTQGATNRPPLVGLKMQSDASTEMKTERSSKYH